MKTPGMTARRRSESLSQRVRLIQRRCRAQSGPRGMGRPMYLSTWYVPRFMCTVAIQKLDKEKMPVADAKKTIWKDPQTRETFVIDNRTGDSYPQSDRLAVDADVPIEATSKRRTLRAPQLTAEEDNHSKSNIGGDHMPDWLREALQVCFLPPHRVLDTSLTLLKGQ